MCVVDVPRLARQRRTSHLQPPPFPHSCLKPSISAPCPQTPLRSSPSRTPSPSSHFLHPARADSAQLHLRTTRRRVVQAWFWVVLDCPACVTLPSLNKHLRNCHNCKQRLFLQWSALHPLPVAYTRRQRPSTATTTSPSHRAVPAESPPAPAVTTSNPAHGPGATSRQRPRQSAPLPERPALHFHHHPPPFLHNNTALHALLDAPIWNSTRLIPTLITPLQLQRDVFYQQWLQ